MTPKEKAEHLVHKFRRHAREDRSGFLVSNEDTLIKHSKECAIISVDQILNQYNNGRFDYKILDEAEAEYWEEVKAEIEKL